MCSRCCATLTSCLSWRSEVSRRSFLSAAAVQNLQRRGRGGKEREDMKINKERTSKQSRAAADPGDRQHLVLRTCLQPPRLTPLAEAVGVCGRNLDGDQWKRCQGDSNCKLR